MSTNPQIQKPTHQKIKPTHYKKPPSNNNTNQFLPFISFNPALAEPTQSSAKQVTYFHFPSYTKKNDNPLPLRTHTRAKNRHDSRLTFHLLLSTYLRPNPILQPTYISISNPLLPTLHTKLI